MEKEFISKKVLMWGFILLIPSCVLCLFLGFLGIGVIILVLSKTVWDLSSGLKI